MLNLLFLIMYFFGRQLDLNKENHLTTFIEFKKSTFISALKSSIEYFQEEEEYEKCAFLLKLQKLKEKV